MRFLFTTFASLPHLQLQVPIAWALRAAGHDVCIASQPDLMREITSSGLTGVPVGQPLDLAGYVRDGGPLPGKHSVADIAEDNPELLTPAYTTTALGTYGRFVSGYLADDEMLADLVTFGRVWKPDMIVWDALTYVGPVAAEILDVPHVRTLFGPDYVAHMLARHREHDLGVDDPMTSWILGRLERSGHRPVRRNDDALTLGHATIDPLPGVLRSTPFVGEHLPIQQIPMSANGIYPAVAIELPKRPRVCLTLGYSSRAYGLPAPSVSAILEGLADLDVEVLATLDSSQLKGTVLPDNVVASDYLPLDLVLPTCSAMISHFGINTLNTAIRHGLPQLYVGDGLDMWGGSRVADSMVAVGVAKAIHHNEISPSLVRTELSELLTDPGYSRAARALQEEVSATSTPHQLVADLERIARGELIA
ncbi:glycosyl transferase family 28 [Nesterenkonia sp. AN1]|uniref:nucleotide disphospho-sugar-binding domain-containing protein n=1 Tax=Nesterenkonia sp. AN1 TaxID=652017 RepID=UPI000452CDB7|nr:nucleotide disphospho-sugar-binding domain-containing protein [Nesterenkonia sp. AN1]EXF23863.1 glycosyl transferase family 28 [Nesterenkonia sp. AN1]